MVKLTLKHVEGITETLLLEKGVSKQPYDLFVVSDGSHEVEVWITHEDDDNPESAIAICNHDACMLSGINGSLHLSALVSMTILKHFSEDHAYYSEGFYDENGNPIERELVTLPL